MNSPPCPRRGACRTFVRFSSTDPAGTRAAGTIQDCAAGLTAPSPSQKSEAASPASGRLSACITSRGTGSIKRGRGNDSTTVAPDSPKPALGWYDSGDSDVIAAQIRQIEGAGFDFAIVHVIAGSPRTWTNARTFFDRLSGQRLKAAIILDGLYTEPAAAKAMWVQKVNTEFAGHGQYLLIDGEPLIMLFSAPRRFRRARRAVTECLLDGTLRSWQ